MYCDRVCDDDVNLYFRLGLGMSLSAASNSTSLPFSLSPAISNEPGLSPSRVEIRPKHSPAAAVPAVSCPPVTVRVLHLVNGEHFAGAERVQSHLGRCLPQYGVQADFACVKPGRFATMVERQAGVWGQAYRFAMSNRFDLRVVPKIVSLVKRNNYDLLHAHTPRSAMVASIVARLTGRPWLYHVHSPAARDSSRRFTNQFNATIEKWSLRNCSHRITVSHSLCHELIAQGAAPETLSVVHNGVPAIRPDRESVPQPGGRWVFGMVALMRPRKGLEVALRAIEILVAQGYDAALRCIGPYESPSYHEEILQLAADLKLGQRVEQLGFQADVPQTLASLDAMLLPSLYGEGLPMVVLEAMAAALPVIATKVEGTPEAIRDGLDGLLAGPGSAESLAEQMKLLMDGRVNWSRMAESACTRHAASFSDFSMSQHVACVYRKVLKRTS